MGEITGKTKSGFEYHYDERILSDWSYLNLLKKLVKSEEEVSKVEKFSLTMDMFSIVLGEKQTEKLVEHVRKNNDGYAPFNVLDEEFSEIIKQKN